MARPDSSPLPAPDLLPPADWANLLAGIGGNPSMSEGWDAFERRVLAFDDAEFAALEKRYEEVDARAKDLGGMKLFTRGNLLRDVGHRAVDLAFHYRVTGSEASWQKALKIARWIFAAPEWVAQAKKEGWKSDLWTADFTAAVSLVMALGGDALEADERSRWADDIGTKGIEPLLADWIDPRTRIHALDSMGHNWWSVCVSGAALGLFVTRDRYPEADAWLERIADCFVEFFNYPGNILQNKQPTFGPQGDFIESIGYLDYTLHNFVLVADLYRHHLGRDLVKEVPVLERVCDYYMASVLPLEGKVQRLNFGDMGNGPDTMGSYNHHPTCVWLWLAREFRREDLLHLVRRSHGRPTDLLEFLFWPQDLAGESFAGAPGDTVFETIGTAILRDGYDEGSTVFAIKTGETWNHNHCDAGSFILSSKGQEFLIDSGATEYSNPLQYSYFKASEGHNLVLHDGRGQDTEFDYAGTKFMGRIRTRLFAPDYRYLLADATGPWEGIYRRFYRHVLWIDDLIVLLDDLQAAYAAPWTQLFHYRGEATTTSGATRITNGGKTLAIHHLFPRVEKAETREGSLSFIEADATKYRYRIDTLPYLALHYAGAERREKFLHVLELPDGKPKTVERIEAPGVQGVRIRTAEGVREIFCNLDADGRKMHQNSLVAIGELQMDAFITTIHRSTEGRLLDLSFHNGSFVKLGGDTLFSGLLKGDAVLHPEGDTLRIHSTFEAATTIDCAIGGRTAKRVRIPAGAAEVTVKF